MKGELQENQQDEWLHRLKENDQQVLQELYVFNFRKVEKWVMDNKGTSSDAEDIYQEAFVAAWRNVQLSKVKLESRDKFQGYLFRIAQYKWIDHLRKTKQHQLPVLLVPEEELWFADEEQEALVEQVRGKFNEMKEPCKEVLHRFYFLRQGMSEIANAFSWTEATAKNNKYRCLQQLRNSLLPKKSKT